jgi:nucleotide-binding universal stress UspA family protein
VGDVTLECLKEENMTVQHILVPLDFSADADQALEYAIVLASTLQARLTLLHVLLTVPPWSEGDRGRGLPEDYLRQLAAEVQQGLATRQQRVQDAGLEGHSLLVYGVPFQGILDTAREQKVDLIIMSTHGRTGLKHVLLGSVAEKVVRLAPCPVLVTRSTASTPSA